MCCILNHLKAPKFIFYLLLRNNMKLLMIIILWVVTPWGLKGTYNVSEKDTVYSLGAVSLKCWYLPISPFGNTTQNNHHLQCHKNVKSHQSGALKTQMKISDQWSARHLISGLTDASLLYRIYMSHL